MPIIVATLLKKKKNQEQDPVFQKGESEAEPIPEPEPELKNESESENEPEPVSQPEPEQQSESEHESKLIPAYTVSSEVDGAGNHVTQNCCPICFCKCCHCCKIFGSQKLGKFGKLDCQKAIVQPVGNFPSLPQDCQTETTWIDTPRFE